MAEVRALLQKIREKGLLNAAQLAEAAGISYHTWRSWQVGRRNPRIEHLRSLAQALETKASVLRSLSADLNSYVDSLWSEPQAVRSEETVELVPVRSQAPAVATCPDTTCPQADTMCLRIVIELNANEKTVFSELAEAAEIEINIVSEQASVPAESGVVLASAGKIRSQIT